MKLWLLVWSALRRKPADVFLVCLAVTAAFTLCGMMLGLHTTYRGLAERMRQDRLYVNVRFPSSSGLKMPIAMREQIARIPGVTAVSTFDTLRGYYQDPRNVVRVRVLDHNARLTSYGLTLTPAQWDQLAAARTGVLMSAPLARTLHLRAGDPFPVVSTQNPRADGSPVWPFEVLAVVPGTRDFVLANRDYVDVARPPPEQGRTIEFDIAVRDPTLGNRVSVAVDESFANSGTPTWTIPDRAAEENVQRSGISAATVTWPVAGAGFFMILLVSANGIAQSVRERLPEFAVLSAVGFPWLTLSGLVLVEALVPCVLGALLGLGIAELLTAWPARYLPQDLQGVPAPTLSPLVWAWALAFGVGLALAGSVPPMLRLRRLAVSQVLAGR